MIKIKPLALISAFCLVGMLSYAWYGNSQAPQASVQLTTTPSLAQIQPFEAEASFSQSPTQLRLRALDASGKPLENAKIHLQILTREPNPWLTTDFPIVEGTTLLDIEASAPNGELQLQQMLPIRGTYQLKTAVTALSGDSFSSFSQTLPLSIGENSAKYLNLAILLGILLLTGAVGGWVIGGRQKTKSGEIAPQTVRLLLSGLTVVAIAALLYVNINAEFAQAHMSMAMSHTTEEAPAAAKPAQLISGGLNVALSGDRTATVGQLAKLEVRINDAQTQQPVTDVILKVTTKSLEGEWTAFAYEGTPDAEGKLAWQQQFFDGAPHSIEVEISPKANSARTFLPFQVAQNIAVEGVAPPLFVRLVTLCYFVAVVAIGFLVSFAFQRKHSQSLA